MFFEVKKGRHLPNKIRSLWFFETENVGTHFPIVWHWTHKNTPDQQQCVQFRKAHKSVKSLHPNAQLSEVIDRYRYFLFLFLSMAQQADMPKCLNRPHFLLFCQQSISYTQMISHVFTYCVCFGFYIFQANYDNVVSTSFW